MRKLWIGLIGLALLAAVATWWTVRPAEPDWTTSSPEAAAELDLALDAAMKHYWKETDRHLQRALELDPEFVAAKLVALERNGENREQLLAELSRVDPERLTPRERFLLEYRLAQEAGRLEEADALITEFLERYPTDPFALANCSAQAWLDQDWSRAEQHYRRLLEADPNWVTARNRLGYIAMAQGRFDEAEEQFRAYRFVAPEQPNPHDSMGELLTLLGRYDEARTELEEALELRPDFCHSYRNLLELEILQGLDADLSSVIERAERHCDSRHASHLRCEAAAWKKFFSGDYDPTFEGEDADCPEVLGADNPTLHRMAALDGRYDDARAAEESLRRKLDEFAKYPIESKAARAVLLHMTGTRLTAEGNFDEAARYLQKADDLLVYFGDGLGILKLYNRMQLAFAYERLGETEKSHAILAKVETVNPAFVGVYPWLRGLFAVSPV